MIGFGNLKFVLKFCIPFRRLCTPYSMEACKDAAASISLEWVGEYKGSKYSDKGCFAVGTAVYYSSCNGDDNIESCPLLNAELSTPALFRPPGYDCKKYTSG